METDFRCELKTYRVAQGLTQERLAEKIGVRRETIMRLEKAQYNPSFQADYRHLKSCKGPHRGYFNFAQSDEG